MIAVTGAAGGIGEALARRFAAESPRVVVVADVDGSGARSVAGSLPGGVGEPHEVDVSSDAACRGLVDTVVARHGRIDVLFSNAGVLGPPEFEAPDDEWRRVFEINTMAHVRLARAALPAMVERGEGYFAATVSAAGLLNLVTAAPYGVTKAAALSFMEWVAIAYGGSGVRVSCLCPQGVRTNMLASDPGGILEATALEPSAVADLTVDAMKGPEPFLVLPHPEVLDYFQRKASDYDRWIRGMRRFRQQALGLRAEGGSSRPA